MKRVSVDIGGTFTDCFVAWSGRYVEGKALTTHHNLALGTPTFNVGQCFNGIGEGKNVVDDRVDGAGLDECSDRWQYPAFCNR